MKCAVKTFREFIIVSELRKNVLLHKREEMDLL